MNSYIHDINDNNKKDLLLFTLFSMVLFLVEYQFLIQEENIYTTFFQIQLLVVYFTILWKSYKKFGFFSLFSLVLIGFFVFSVGGVLHFVVSGESMLKLEEIGYGSFYFSNVIIQESLLVYTVFFVVLYSSYSFFYKKKYSNPPVALKTNMYFLKIGKFNILFCSSIPSLNRLDIPATVMIAILFILIFYVVFFKSSLNLFEW